MAVPLLSAAIGTSLTLTPMIDHPAPLPLKNISLLRFQIVLWFSTACDPKTPRVPNFLNCPPLNFLSNSLPFRTWSNPWKEPTFAAFIVFLLPTLKALERRGSLQHSAKTALTPSVSW